MSQVHNQPLAISVNYSRRLHVLLALAHALALLAGLSASLPISCQVVLILALAINYLGVERSIRQTTLGFAYRQATGWQMTELNETMLIKILPSSILNRRAVFLDLEIPNKGTKLSGIAEKTRSCRRKSVLVMADALSEDDFRRFVVKLKTAWQEAPETNAL